MCSIRMWRNTDKANLGKSIQFGCHFILRQNLRSINYIVTGLDAFGVGLLYSYTYTEVVFNLLFCSIWLTKVFRLPTGNTISLRRIWLSNCSAAWDVLVGVCVQWCEPGSLGWGLGRSGLLWCTFAYPSLDEESFEQYSLSLKVLSFGTSGYIYLTYQI